AEFVCSTRNESRGRDARAAGESFSFDASFEGANANMISAKHLNEVYVCAFGSKMRVVTDFGPEFVHHGFVGVGNEQDGVGNSCVDGMEGLRAIRERDLLVEAEIFWFG